MKLFKKLKKGFTLVELVVVIAVIAILTGVSVGAYFGITESAKNSKVEQEAADFRTHLQVNATEKWIGTEADGLTGVTAVYEKDGIVTTGVTNTNVAKFVSALTEGDYNVDASADDKLTIATDKATIALYGNATTSTITHFAFVSEGLAEGYAKYFSVKGGAGELLSDVTPATQLFTAAA